MRLCVCRALVPPERQSSLTSVLGRRPSPAQLFPTTQSASATAGLSLACPEFTQLLIYSVDGYLPHGHHTPDFVLDTGTVCLQEAAFGRENNTRVNKQARWVYLKRMELGTVVGMGRMVVPVDERVGRGIAKEVT